MVSDFLFRMIERAAGRSSSCVPRPPRQYQWPSSWERPAPVCGSPALPPPKTAQAVSLSSPAPHSLSDSRVLLDQAIAPAFSTPGPVSTSMEREVAPEARRPNEFAGTLRAETSLTTAPKENSTIQPSELASPEAPPPVPLQHAPDNKAQVRYPATEKRASFRDSLLSPVMGEQEPATASRLVAEFPAVQQYGPEETSPAPALMPSVRTEGARRSNPHSLRETPDTVVEVNIGRVDVRLDAPKQPAPQPVSRPRGFAEYESLRRYVASPWSRRR